jgi:hypothetical protein
MKSLEDKIRDRIKDLQPQTATTIVPDSGMPDRVSEKGAASASNEISGLYWVLDTMKTMAEADQSS